MQPHIPEELEAMAFLIGQSKQMDDLWVDKPVTMVTDTSTLRRGMNDYVQQQRHQQPHVALPTHPVQYPQVPQPPIFPIPNYVPPQELPQGQQFAPMPQKVDDGQLEFNLEPTKAEEIIILLKEISNKLTKQNNLLEKQHANQSKQKTVSEPIIKLVPNK
jgi:hypothetical protein